MPHPAAMCASSVHILNRSQPHALSSLATSEVSSPITASQETFQKQVDAKPDKSLTLFFFFLSEPSPLPHGNLSPALTIV